jgi:hypothetical protein
VVYESTVNSNGAFTLQERKMDNRLEQNETVDVEIEKIEEKPQEDKVVKGVDIYVENDPKDLDRMLGIAPTEENEDIDDSEESDEDSSTEDSLNESGEEVDEVEDIDLDEEEPPIRNLAEKLQPVCLLDFMHEDPDVFSYLSCQNGIYSIESIPMDDKKAIRQAVKSPHYIFRYPKLVLNDPVLGYSTVVDNKPNCTGYVIYFPDYSILLDVPNAYAKPEYSSLTMKEYLENLVQHIRPSNISILHYSDSITITSLKVIETGVIEVTTNSGTSRYTLRDDMGDLSFYSILHYIRELSDSGEDKITLKLIPQLFTQN